MKCDELRDSSCLFCTRLGFGVCVSTLLTSAQTATKVVAPMGTWRSLTCSDTPNLEDSIFKSTEHETPKHMKQHEAASLPNLAKSCQILAKFLPSFAALLYDSHESDPGLQALVATRWMTCWNTCCTDQSTRVLCSSICSKRPGNSLITKSHEIIKARNLSSHRHSTRGTCQNPRPMFPQLIIMCVYMYIYIYIYTYIHTHDTHNIYIYIYDMLY